MEQAVRRFARNILLIHVALLAVVLGALFLASRGIYDSARDQALKQAETRQKLLANQTAAGIASTYRSVMSVMDLVPHENADPAGEEQRFLFRSIPLPQWLRPKGSDKAPEKVPTDRERPTMLGVLLSRQLEGRISHLFIADKGTLATRNIQFQSLGADGSKPSTQPASALEAKVTPDEVAHAFGSFLKTVDAQTVSPFQVVGGVGMNLVCLPIGKGKSAVVVAAVPVERIQGEFLNALMGDYSTGVYLFDDSMRAMASSRPKLVGQDVRGEDDTEVRRMLGAFNEIGFDGSLVVNQASRLAGERFEPGILTAAPIEILPGKQWKLVIGTSLTEVDRVVGAFYRKTVVWAALLAAAVTLILGSTAVQMIRSRARYERDRHNMLTRELDQARLIQLAWLPQKPLTRWEIDLAAVNRPANHISGDFYNWFDLPDGRTAVVIGDVTGHGMSAAFLMATAQLLVRNTLPVVRDPGRCLEEVNRQLCVQVFNGQFVTMQILVFDPEARTVEIATAGHPAPLLCGPDKCFAPIAIEPQLVLGVETDTEIPTETFDLPADATLLLYTDGVTDLQSDDGRRLYLNGLKDGLSERTGSASEVLDALMSTLDRYRGGRDIGDDLTVVVVRFQPHAHHEVPVERVPEQRRVVQDRAATLTS